MTTTSRVIGRRLLAWIAAGTIATLGGCLLPPLEQPRDNPPSPDSGGLPGDDTGGESDTYDNDTDDTGTPPDRDTGGEQDTGDGNNGVSAGQVAQMLGNHCAKSSCHASGNQPPTLPESPSPGDVQDLVGKAAVATDGAVYFKAGSAEDSLIWIRMDNGSMPQGGWGTFTVVDPDSYDSKSAAGDEVTERIRIWIDNYNQ